MDFQIRTNAIYAKDSELLNDLKRVAGLLKKEKVTTKEYKEHGSYHPATFMRRFSGWNDALEKAGLKVGLHRTIEIEELFDNMKLPALTDGVSCLRRSFATVQAALVRNLLLPASVHTSV